MTRRYQIYDVFTQERLAGNSLAVVLDAGGLDDVQMQAIAREFNLAETIFILPPAEPVHSASVRIFTPACELPFAGHPTVGAAVCLASERFGPEGRHDSVVVLEEQIGVVRCGVTVEGRTGFAEFDCPRLPERAGEAPFKELIAAATNLAPAEIGFENHVPGCWSVGSPFYFVPVRNMAVLAKARAVNGGWITAFGSHGAYLYTRETEGHDRHFRARMFAPGLGIAEDPATGSAAAAFAGAVQEFDGYPDGKHALTIEQGFEMGRPSLVQLEITVEAGEVAGVRIGGYAVRFAVGEIDI